MALSTLVAAFQLGIALAAALTAFRLQHTGLYRRYPVVFIYMIFTALYSIAPVVLDTARSRYFWTWIYCQPIVWVLDVLVVRELCQVILEKHPGLVTLGRWGMYLGVVVAGSLSFLALLPHIKSTMPARSKMIAYWVAAGRGTTFALAIFLILMLFALSRYPVHLSKNVILTAVLFTLVFLSDCLEAILRTIFDRHMSPWLATALSGTEMSLLLIWFFRLNPEGEHRQFDWIRFGPEYEKRMLERLDTLSRIVSGQPGNKSRQ